MSLRLAALVVLLALAGYGIIVAAWPIISGPSISVRLPAAASAGVPVPLEGVAKHTETLWLNGAPLLIDQSGRFSIPLTFPSGGVVVSLTATDRFGRERTETRSLLVH